MQTDTVKRCVLQTLVGAFPGNALLYKRKLQSSESCDLCGAPGEKQAHIQYVCVALNLAKAHSYPHTP
jgi:hypothetical protein